MCFLLLTLNSVLAHFINCMCVSLFVLFCNCVVATVAIFLVVFVFFLFTYVYVLCSSRQGRMAVAYNINQIKPMYYNCIYLLTTKVLFLVYHQLGSSYL